MAIGLQQLQPNMSYATLVNIVNQNLNLLDSITTTQIFKDTNGIPRILIGKDANGVYRLIVSKVGVDVRAATDDQLIFNSNQNTLKVVDSKTITLNRSAGQDSVSAQVAATGTATAFFAWATVTNVSPALTYQLPYFAPKGDGTMAWGVRGFYDPTVGAVKFIHEAYDTAVKNTAYNISIKYYLLQETLL